MKNLHGLILSLAMAAFANCGNSALPVVPARYGEAADYMEGILKYPDFTIRYQSEIEQEVTGTRTPWVTQVFEVLDKDCLTIGGDITFNSAELANARRFDVRGKIYVAEMFYTTADASGNAHAIIPRGRIIVWDEASAQSHNVALREIWARESVRPGTRYSSRNAYADGEPLPDFTPLSGVRVRGAGEDQAVARYHSFKTNLISAKQSATVRSSPGTAYGERVSWRNGVISYPDFCVQFQQRTDFNPSHAGAANVEYRFLVFDQAGSETSISFSSGNLANGRSFSIGGRIYFAEMFSTTATATNAGGQSPPGLIPLREDDLIIWSQAAATAGNPRILAAWNPVHPGAGSVVWFAAGVPLQNMFTGTYTIGDANSFCRFPQLDQPIVALQCTATPYSPELAGSGFVANVGGFLIVEADGVVSQAVTTHGNETRFKEITQEALRRWKFSRPTKNGKPVKALLSFRWVLSEPSREGSGLEFF